MTTKKAIEILKDYKQTQSLEIQNAIDLLISKNEPLKLVAGDTVRLKKGGPSFEVKTVISADFICTEINGLKEYFYTCDLVKI